MKVRNGRNLRFLSGKENMMEQESIQQTVDKVLGGIAAKREETMDKARQGQENGGGKQEREFKEITLKFGMGCVRDEFQGKDGNAYREILVPNFDQKDKRPWQTFVVKANHVHKNKFGKGMWVKLPAGGIPRYAAPL